MSHYRISLKNCTFFARHGVYNEEERLGQRFHVDVEMLLDGMEALKNDNIEGTVDYGAAFHVIERIVTGERRYLIEALALEVATALCNEFEPVLRAEVTIRKPNAPVNEVLDHVQVTVTYPPADSGG